MKNTAPKSPQKLEAHTSSESNTPISLGPEEFDPDHPISPGDNKDRLGFRSVAKKLARSLLSKETSHGLVMAINGEWGSGKSSLVNILVDELEKNKEQAPEIVRFEPWLVGNRDGMLVELMSDLASAVEKIEDLEKGTDKNAKEEMAKLSMQFVKYGSMLSRGAVPLFQLAGLVGLPAGDLISKVLKHIGMVEDAFVSENSLQTIKIELTEGLCNLHRRIVVIIDDLDRLEPGEAAEIMRLIRAVADFPNIIYILCYDHNILAKSLEVALSVDDGTAFLEKMIQISFKVPRPEAFDLRRWFQNECLDFYQSTSKEKLSDDAFQRLKEIFDLEGGLLKTPRDVIRALNAIKLYWPPIFDKADYPDLVWLQMIRLENEPLYSWIERYLSDWVAVSQGASISLSDREKYSKELNELLPEDSPQNARSTWTFKKFVPGIQTNVDGKDRFDLFKFDNDAEISTLENDRRLGSPQHSRYYFSFAKPEGALDDKEFYDFISSAESGKNLEDLCKVFLDQKRPQGGTKFDVLIDRLRHLDKTRLPDNAIPSILKVLGDFMDEVGHREGKAQDGRLWSIIDSIDLFHKLFGRLSNEERNNMLKEIFTSGKAIGWLMSDLIRDEIFAHGLYGNKPKVKEEWIFSKDELKVAFSIMWKRFKLKDRNKIINTPNVLSLMYGWYQSKDEAGVLEWVQEQHKTDAKFLKFLNACRGRKISSVKKYYLLNRKDLEQFMDFDKALKRLRGISENKKLTKANRALAKGLLEAAKIGENSWV